MACQIIDNDDIAIATTVAPANEYADRIAALEARINKQDQDIIALRSLLMSLGMKQASAVAAKLKSEGEPLTAEQEAAVHSLVGGMTLSKLRWLNDCCIVGSAGKMGLKITRKGATVSKFRCPPEMTIGLDDTTRAILFG